MFDKLLDYDKPLNKAPKKTKTKTWKWNCYFFYHIVF